MDRRVAGASGASIEQELYAKREKVYPRQVHGLYAVLRVASVLVLLGLYYVVPWLRWGDRQAVLFDLPARKFYIFGLSFWPQDLFYLTALLIVAALSLFFFTALAGRLWCGYACPQTVWTETFLWIERMIEGDRAKQMKLDRSPGTRDKYSKKALKHLLWGLFSLWTGFTFVGYFTPITELAHDIASFDVGPWAAFWVLFYGFATYGNAGWMREQVCIYMCPYARFQSAMFDKNTLIISYDPKRGEPRGSRRRSVDPSTVGLGDCIDCTLCVQVCPTGIDIRDGLQYQCIGCAACIDACDGVMEKMNYPKGLVRYTTENAVEGRATRVLRPRIIVYSLILLGMMGSVAYGIAARVPIALDVIRDRNALFRETDDGLIENVYTLKLINKSEADNVYVVAADGLQGIVLLVDRTEVNVPAGAVVELPVRVQVPSQSLAGTSNEIRFSVGDTTNAQVTVTEDARFLGPRGE